jgi:hypothetical protein
VEKRKIKLFVYDVLINEQDPKSVIVRRFRRICSCCRPSLTLRERKSSSFPDGREARLAGHFIRPGDFDIIIDCPRLGAFDAVRLLRLRYGFGSGAGGILRAEGISSGPEHPAGEAPL